MHGIFLNIWRNVSLLYLFTPQTKNDSIISHTQNHLYFFEPFPKPLLVFLQQEIQCKNYRILEIGWEQKYYRTYKWNDDVAPKYHQTTENWATVGSQTQLGANVNMDNFSFWDLVCILPASPYSMFLQNGIGFDFLCQVFAVLNIHLYEHQSIFPYIPEKSIL